MKIDKDTFKGLPCTDKGSLSIELAIAEDGGLLIGVRPNSEYAKDIPAFVQKRLLQVAKGMCYAMLENQKVCFELGKQVGDALGDDDWITFDAAIRQHKINVAQAIHEEYGKEPDKNHLRVACIEGKEVEGWKDIRKDEDDGNTDGGEPLSKAQNTAD